MNKISSGISGSKWVCGLIVFFSLLSLRAQTSATASVATNPPPAPRRPNIILIIADNIGYVDLGCYGQTKIKTPNLDRLAAAGVRFTDFYAGSPEDQASRASLFTGLEPKHVGASFSHPLPTDAITVAAILKEAGYRTGLMGEWNLGDTAPVEPNTKGFEEFAGFLSQTHARDYFSESLYRQDTFTGSNRLVTIPENWQSAHGSYLPDTLGEMGINYIKNHVPDKFNHYNSFFLCLSYPVPHDGQSPHKPTYLHESWPPAARNRAEMISHMDSSIGRVLETLGFLKLETNTVVIFTSIGGAKKEGTMDPNFFGSSGRLRDEAGSVYEGGIRVPLIVRWPARIKPGQVTDFTCAAWDILPTAMEISFQKAPQKTDGFSLMPVLTGKGKTNVHESFYWESHVDGLQQAARMGDWKLVQIGTNAPVLYNLSFDIGEKSDDAQKNPDPEVVKKLKSLLDSAAKE